MSEVLFIGIDSGKSGGIAALAGKSVYYTKMPTTEIEIWRWIKGLKMVRTSPDGSRCMIESINYGWVRNHNAGSVSKLYGSYMQLRGFLVAAGIPFETVMASKWQKTLGIKPRDKKHETDTMWKDRLVSVARKLFPKLSIWKLPAKIQRAVADALLIAEYCRRKHKEQ